MCRSRYVSLKKMQLHHLLLSATAMNLLQVSEWLMGRPKVSTSRSFLCQVDCHPCRLINSLAVSPIRENRRTGVRPVDTTGLFGHHKCS